MHTTHKIFFENSSRLNTIEDNTVDLIVTSPPYPMIEMWDGIFSKQDNNIKEALDNSNGNLAFELMHKLLDKVWNEVYRVLKDGCFACINIGDATRTIGGNFQIFMNHARIISACIETGFTALPCIIWRKQTNAPNKFMGSGVLPAGAYVTLEHEFILIFRKGSKREFNSAAEKAKRQESSYFYEERNTWFSDQWDFKGISQKMTAKNSRDRSAAFPFELAYRLINMYSVKDDVVLDPFLGTGTTTLAAIASQRNSVGFEIDKDFNIVIHGNIVNSINFCNSYIEDRFSKHMEFIQNKEGLKHINIYYNIPVTTLQEKNIILPCVYDIQDDMADKYEITHTYYQPKNINIGYNLKANY